MCNKKYIIAIDGACAVGKSVIAKELGKKLNIIYIDTGSMYRACSLYFIKNNIDITEDNVNKYINEINVDIEYDKQNNIEVYLNKENVTLKIRENEVSSVTSQVAKYKIVREKFVNIQRKMAENKSVVLDGRDIGTVVFPNADLKIYLVASIDIRAKRRKKDLEEKGEFLSIEQIKTELEKRDLQDTTRIESPLKKADDAIVIDDTDKTINEVVDEIIDLLKKKIGE